MADEQHWTAEPTSYRMSPEHKPVWALLYDATPGGRKNEDGTTSYSLRFPSLILSEYIADPEATAKRLAERLNAPSSDPRLAMAREALEFYAAPGSWQWDIAPDPAGSSIPGTSPADIDGGERARATLTALEEGGAPTEPSRVAVLEDAMRNILRVRVSATDALDQCRAIAARCLPREG